MFAPSSSTQKNLFETLRRNYDRHFEEVAAHKIKNIARAENFSIEEVRRAIEIIRALNPKPGSAYGGVTKFIVPDVKVTESGEIFLNAPNFPRVKISDDYSDLKDFDAETKNFLARHLNSMTMRSPCRGAGFA